MPDATFIKEIVAQAETKQIEIGERPYTTKPVHPVREPVAEPMTVHTLTGFAEYINANPDGLEIKKLVVSVEKPTYVLLESTITGQFRQRERYLQADAYDVAFRFDRFYPLEEFVIALQSRFVPSETVDSILRIVGNLTEGATVQYEDDGVTQRTTAKRGIARVEAVNLPNPVSLAPYRTFPEIDQPESKFVLRLNGSKDGAQPQAALFEADGGAWKNEATKRIQRWLRQNIVDESVVVIA